MNYFFKFVIRMRSETDWSNRHRSSCGRPAPGCL